MRMEPVCGRIAEDAVPAGFSGSSRATGDAVPMQRNRIIAPALAGGLLIGAASFGFVIAQLASYSGHGHAGQYWPAANGLPGGTAAPSPGSPLAQFIAQRAGTRLAGRAPQDVHRSQVTALSEQDPAGASISARAGTITFHTTAVSFTVVAIAPGQPDMTFTVAGLSDPAIIVPRGAQVTVRFINNDTDEAHGWLITGNKPPFGFGQPATPAIAGAFTGIIGDPTAAGDGASTISFTASSAGSYDYICPMPGHAQMGMHGSFTVR
jgi:rusticyanin